MSDRPIPTEADRYVVVAARTRPEPRALFPDDSWVLVDLRTDTVLGWDGGEPEDQLLVRDWSWVPDLLNRLDREQVQAIAGARAEGYRAGWRARGEADDSVVHARFSDNETGCDHMLRRVSSDICDLPDEPPEASVEPDKTGGRKT